MSVNAERAPATVRAAVAGPRKGHHTLPSQPPPGLGGCGGQPVNASAAAGVRGRGGRQGTLPSTLPALDDAGGRRKMPDARVERERRLIATATSEDTRSGSLSLSLELPGYLGICLSEKSWLGGSPRIWS